jgi:hypothetical protein
MADTAGIIKIEDIVDSFVLRYKVPMDDHLLYVDHACAFYRHIRTHHAGGYKETKVDVDSLGFIDFPSDYMDLVKLYLPKDGSIWTFTRNDNLVTTTTLVDGADTFDSTYGEGTDIKDARITGFGAVGAVNEYYYTIIEDDRQILVSGITSDEVTMRYKTSGLNLSGETYVPSIMEDAIMAKLKKEKAYIDGDTIGERQLLAQELKEEILLLRKAGLPTLDEIKDALRSVRTPTPMR